MRNVSMNLSFLLGLHVTVTIAVVSLNNNTLLPIRLKNLCHGLRFDLNTDWYDVSSEINLKQ